CTAMVGCFFWQAEDVIRDLYVTGVQTCALPISAAGLQAPSDAHGEALDVVGAVLARGVHVARRLQARSLDRRPNGSVVRPIRVRSEERRVGNDATPRSGRRGGPEARGCRLSIDG